MWKNFIKEKVFSSFYEYFCEKGLLFFKEMENGKEILETYMNEDILVRNCWEQVQELPVRTLIYDMHLCNNNKMLMGENKSDKYDYYNFQILNKMDYIISLSKKYPELFRLMNLKIKYTVFELWEIVKKLQTNYMEVTNVLCGGKQFHKILDIQLGMSEPHKNGKTVAKVILDNGYTIVYKPHCIKKEFQYEQVINYIEKKNRMKVFSRKFCDFCSYGWENFLCVQNCQDINELKNFFLRYGFHIFICWVMNGEDIHGENVLAVGEFPIILDAETIPGKIDHILHVSGEVYNIIRSSVLNTGILPISMFGRWGVGCFSALHCPGKQKIGLRLPYIENDKTVDMKITYKETTCDIKGSLPLLDGKTVNPIDYIDDVSEGIIKAYKVFMENKRELKFLFEKLYETSSRVIQRNTQEYKMLLSVSLHPVFMMDSNKRFSFLQNARIWSKQRRGEKSIHKSEIDSLYNLDIPYFESDVGDELSRLDEISWKMVKRQLWFVRASLMTMSETGLVKNDQSGRKTCKKSEEQKIEEIANEIIESVICNEEGERSWIGVKREKNGQWRYNISDIYFYGGLSGIAVFISKVATVYQGEKYKSFYLTLLQRMKDYVRCVKDSMKDVRLIKTGALDGEGSIILSLIIQYRITGNKKLLEIAEEHVNSLEKLWHLDANYDFLSGNAGFIYVLIKLYECTNERKYLLLAIQVEAWLWTKRKCTSYGCGWIIGQEKVPLTGMSHGNSGFIFSYALLCKYTRDQSYVNKIRELLRYENNFYSNKISNWLDLRGYIPGEVLDEIGMCTWCHGAPGILISRLALRELIEFEDSIEVKRDIERAVRKLMDSKDIKGMCLCHGKCGNMIIMKKYLQKFPVNGEEEHIVLEAEAELKTLICREQGYKVEERYQMGFMNGMAGIGMVLLYI